MNIDFTGPLISADSAPSAALMAMAIFLVLEEVVFLSSAIRHLTFKTLKDVVVGNNLFGLKFGSGSGRRRFA